MIVFDFTLIEFPSLAEFRLAIVETHFARSFVFCIGWMPKAVQVLHHQINVRL